MIKLLTVALAAAALGMLTSCGSSPAPDMSVPPGLPIMVTK
ncbi:hypothetical protein N9733_07870 [Akkermansiaceae bacterium]|nr:hypothetical protein [Akkermansiaceae bacterium]